MIDQPQGEKPALTIVIQSWWTPALAVIMLVIGLLAGYFGRPLVNRNADNSGNIAAVTSPEATLPVNQNPAVTSSIDPTIAAINSAEQAMQYLISHATHFQGDANAKVTMVEFSDYQ